MTNAQFDNPEDKLHQAKHKTEPDPFAHELASHWGKPGDRSTVDNTKPPVPTWDQSESLGAPARSQAGKELEQLALSVVGKRIDDGFGADGCMESISNHILKPYFNSKGESFPGFSDSHAFLNWAKHHPEAVSVAVIPQHNLRPEDLQPGDVIIGNKSTGNHVMIVSRLPESWGGSERALALLGNTGHPEWCPDGPNGPHFRIQEFIGTAQDEAHFGTHHGGPESYSPNNPYNMPGATWTVVRVNDR